MLERNFHIKEIQFLEEWN